MLSQFLTAELFAFLLVFCRLGTALMLLPGFGESYVHARARLMLALLFSLILVPVITTLPPPPTAPSLLALLIVGEMAVGLFLGALSRLLISAMHMAGTVIAFQSSLSSALTQDMAIFQGQDTAIGNLLTLSAVVLLFLTDMHHMMLRALADSYNLFIPGTFPIVADFANHAGRALSGAFKMAMQLSAPHIVLGTILYFGAGLISRLMPGIQIFFIMMPAQLLLSFLLLVAVISSIMMWYLEYYKDSFSMFMAS